MSHQSFMETSRGLPHFKHSDTHMPGKATRRSATKHTTAIGGSEVWALDLLKREARESVRVVRDHADRLTTKDHYLLSDVADGKYLTGVFRFQVLALRCREVAAATTFAERLRGFQVQHHPQAHVDLLTAFGAESRSNGEFDAAQIAFAADPTEANRQWALEAGNRQLVETHRSMMALHRSERGR